MKREMNTIMHSYAQINTMLFMTKRNIELEKSKLKHSTLIHEIVAHTFSLFD